MPSSNNSGRGPFASALRNLAKQADIKEDEPVDQRAPSTGTVGSNSASNNMHLHQRTSGSAENRNNEPAAVPVSVDDRHRKRQNSPPPEKVCIHHSLFVLNLTNIQITFENLSHFLGGNLDGSIEQ